MYSRVLARTDVESNRSVVSLGCGIFCGARQRALAHGHRGARVLRARAVRATVRARRAARARQQDFVM